MLKEWWEKIVRVEAGSSAGMLVFIVIAMSGVTVVGLFVFLIVGHWLPLVVVGVGWLSFLMFALLRATVLEHGSKVVMATGSSTPSVAQHSNIEAMEARGRYAEAAEAYKAVIVADPADLVACEKLGQLALRELKDFQLAVFAYREAEKRVSEPKRQLGYAMLVAGIYRDNLKDYGKAMVELRRIVSRYPEAPNRARLSAEIDELKAMHFEPQ